MNRNDEVLKGLKIAMEAELTGHEFYKNAAKAMRDAKAKEALSEMAEEEMNHFNHLRHQYRSVLEKGDFDFSKKLGRKGRGGPLFSDAIKARIKDSHYEVSVLTVGMKLELEAIKYYRSCARNAKSDAAKSLFEELAEWEEGHYQALEKELETMKEEYWQANNFVPM